jgi:hypothetical protein
MSAVSALGSLPSYLSQAIPQALSPAAKPAQANDSTDATRQPRANGRPGQLLNVVV